MLSQSSLTKKLGTNFQGLPKKHQKLSLFRYVESQIHTTEPNTRTSQDCIGYKPTKFGMDTKLLKHPSIIEEIDGVANVTPGQKIFISQFTKKNESQKKFQNSQIFELIISKNNSQKQESTLVSQPRIKGKEEEDSKRVYSDAIIIDQSQIKIAAHIIGNQNKDVYAFMMNNLIQLFSKVPGEILRCYIKQLSLRYQIPYEKILVSFGIEQTIKKFFQMQDLACQLNQNYVLSVLDSMIPDFLLELRISDWNVIKKIGIGLCNRYSIKQKYQDKWLLNAIRRKARALTEAGVNLQQIYLMYKNTTKTDYIEEPSSQMMKNLQYTNLLNFIKRSGNKLKQINLQDDQNQQKALNSDKQGIDTNLKYFLKLKQEMIQRQNQKLRRKKDKDKQFLQGNFCSLGFEISITKANVPQGVKIQDFENQIQVNSGSHVQSKQSETIQIEDKFRLPKNTQMEVINTKKNQFLVRKACTSKKLNNSITIDIRKAINEEEESVKPEVLKKLCLFIYNFRNCNPNYSLQSLETLVEKFLTEHLKIPISNQKKYREIWYNFQLSSKNT